MEYNDYCTAKEQRYPKLLPKMLFLYALIDKVIMEE
jgi:hypothetical protein